MSAARRSADGQALTETVNFVIDVETTKGRCGGGGITVDVRIDGDVVWRADLSDGDASASILEPPHRERSNRPDHRRGQAAANGHVLVRRHGDPSPSSPPDGDEVHDRHPVLHTGRTDRRPSRTTAGRRTSPRLRSPRSRGIPSPFGRYEHDAGFSVGVAAEQHRRSPPRRVARHDRPVRRRTQQQTQHSCLLRTDDLAEPRPHGGLGRHRLHAGRRRPVYIGSPMAAPPCCPLIAPAPISGLKWHTLSLELFVAVGGFAQFGQNGQYALVSPTCSPWSAPISSSSPPSSCSPPTRHRSSRTRH